MQVSTPEILWHGGGIENGKPDPVFSVDIHHPTSILATAGIDASIPPKGSVRLWHVDQNGDGHEFIIDLSDHQSSVNVVRFSPCGKMLASASDRMVVIYSVVAGCSWTDASEIRNVERTWLRPSLCEMYDLCWSPDSSYILACSIDQKAEIIRISSRDSIILPGHTHYVQGVAWDPLNQMVITQSADRSIKLHMLKTKPGIMTKLAPKGHTVIKMLDHSAMTGSLNSNTTITNGSSIPLTAADFNTKGKNLYADSTVPSFFRRPAFSPDGALFVTPSGIFKHPTTNTAPVVNGGVSGGNGSAVIDDIVINGTSGKEKVAGGIDKGKSTDPITQSFCTHIFARNYTTTPLVSLVGLEDPSVAVRFSPVLYKHINTTAVTVSPTSNVTAATTIVPPSLGKSRNSINKKDIQHINHTNSMIPGRYRMIYAVLTVSAVMVYDTQFPHPIARFGGLHLACINDATWTADGNTLVVCSSDGYISFIHFEPGALGEPIPDDEVPDSVKQTHASVYLQSSSTTTTASSTSTATATSTAAGQSQISQPVAKGIQSTLESSQNVNSTNTIAITTNKKSISAPSVLMTQIMNDRKEQDENNHKDDKYHNNNNSVHNKENENQNDVIIVDFIENNKREHDDISNTCGINNTNSIAVNDCDTELTTILTPGNEKKKKRVALTFVSALGSHHAVRTTINNTTASSRGNDDSNFDIRDNVNTPVIIHDVNSNDDGINTVITSAPISTTASAIKDTSANLSTVSSTNNSSSDSTDPNLHATKVEAAITTTLQSSSSSSQLLNGKIKKRVTTTLISSTPISFLSSSSSAAATSAVAAVSTAAAIITTTAAVTATTTTTTTAVTATTATAAVTATTTASDMTSSSTSSSSPVIIKSSSST